MTIVDNRFTRFGDCAVYIADKDAKPIAIKYPLTEEKIQSAIVAHKYTNSQIDLIKNNYQLSLNEGFDAELKEVYAKRYESLQLWQANALQVSHQAIKKQLTIT